MTPFTGWSVRELDELAFESNGLSRGHRPRVPKRCNTVRVDALMRVPRSRRRRTRYAA